MKPSEMFSKVVDTCPETGEPQTLAGVGSDNDHAFFYTRGKTTAWKHTIKSEEIDPESIPG